MENIERLIFINRMVRAGWLKLMLVYPSLFALSEAIFLIKIQPTQTE